MTSYCVGCGLATDECDGACRRPFDPPRYCPECGKRMRVLVTPTRADATCREHGPLRMS